MKSSEKPKQNRRLEEYKQNMYPDKCDVWTFYHKLSEVFIPFCENMDKLRTVSKNQYMENWMAMFVAWMELDKSPELSPVEKLWDNEEDKIWDEIKWPETPEFHNEADVTVEAPKMDILSHRADNKGIPKIEEGKSQKGGVNKKPTIDPPKPPKPQGEPEASK